VANEYELESKMRLSPGRLLPEFELPQADGEIVNTSMFKGKNMILYFWAADDEKSRQTNEVIKMAYEAYHSYGLEVLAVSLDKDKNLWQTAIRQDELPGTHVSDLQGIRSPVQKLFNLKMQLPMYFLIDSKGRIYDHNRDFGKLQASVIDLYNEDPDF
jgi:peroxiredoxin